LNNIKSVFTISDLENLTGISAHTIRIWERRYNLLSPDRTGTNLRRYCNDDLRKLLNIAVLQEHGERISRLALMSNAEIEERVNDLIQPSEEVLPSINSFKMAMFEFDQEKFNSTYLKLASIMPFADIYRNVIIPLVLEIGKLWQTGCICPAHEHFITNLIRQKLYSQIEMLPVNNVSNTDSEWTRVLFLPPNEMHELGALFLHFLLASKGKNTIYLGQSVETQDLTFIRNAMKGKIIYISWWTVYPEKSEVENYMNDFSNTILKQGDQLWVTGNHLSVMSLPELSDKISVFRNPIDLVHKVFSEIN
jgi:MerR family transcriptional regulator, light-induced transcriptional regulator